MNVIKKIGKGLGITLLVLLGIIILGLLTTTIIHNVRLKANKNFMAENGFYNPVSVGDHSLNLVSYGGNENGHRIIALSGNGGGFPLEIEPLVEKLKEEDQVYYLARPGYDGSDDVKEDMTVEFVVENYRKALQNAGVEAPYVLLPHSYAGIYATYWVSKYPDEIEALVNMEGTIPQIIPEEELADEEDQDAGLGFIRTIINLGIGDVAGGTFFPPDEEYSEDKQRMDSAMQLMTMGSRAFGSEIGNAVKSVTETFLQIQPNNVPKLYITAENGYDSREEFEAADVLSENRINSATEGFTGSDAERRAKAYDEEWENMQYYKKNIMQPYFDKLGNCKVANLPGGHWIHCEKPDECAAIILDFLRDVK